LRNITCGVYQLKLSPSYIQEYLDGESQILIHYNCFSLCLANPRYHSTDAIWEQTPTTRAPARHLQYHALVVDSVNWIHRIYCLEDMCLLCILTRISQEDEILAAKMKFLSKEINSLKSFVEENNLERKSAKWEITEDVHLFIRAFAALTTHRTWKLKTRQNKLYIMLKCQSRSIVKTGVYT
jgi:hypothetical protein